MRVSNFQFPVSTSKAESLIDRQGGAGEILDRTSDLSPQSFVCPSSMTTTTGNGQMTEGNRQSRILDRTGQALSPLSFVFRWSSFLRGPCQGRGLRTTGQGPATETEHKGPDDAGQKDQRQMTTDKASSWSCQWEEITSQMERFFPLWPSLGLGIDPQTSQVHDSLRCLALSVLLDAIIWAETTAKGKKIVMVATTFFCLHLKNSSG